MLLPTVFPVSEMKDDSVQMLHGSVHCPEILSEMGSGL